MDEQAPWDINADLKRQILLDIAACILRGGKSANGDFKDELGDSAWTNGTLSFSRGVSQIERLAKSGRHSTLKILKAGRELIFQIGKTTWRVGRYRGYSIAKRTLRLPHVLEKLFIQESIFGAETNEGSFWRFLWDVDGIQTVGLYAVEFNRSETPIYRWQIPLDQVRIEELPTMQMESPADLGPPAVTRIADETETSTGTAKDD